MIMKLSNILSILSVLTGSCYSQDNSLESSNNIIKKIEVLNQDFNKNYGEIEKLLVSTLQKEGKEFFIKNKYYQILGRFEPTLKIYCEIVEELRDENCDLLFSYLHLNDIENVKKQQEKIKDDPNYFIFQYFHEFEDSKKTMSSKLISIKYDQRVDEYAQAVFENVHQAEEFINNEWKDFAPPIIRVIFLNSNGPGPYNPNMNETVFQVKSVPKSEAIKAIVGIVHETFHFSNIYAIDKMSTFGTDWGMNSFKLLDEGYAQLIQQKFVNSQQKGRKFADISAKNVILEGKFDLKDLKTRWIELFSSNDVSIYTLALSFAYFLEDRYGKEKHKNLFFPIAPIAEDSWLKYVNNYFGTDLDSLIDIYQAGMKAEIPKLSEAELKKFCGDYYCESDKLERKIIYKDGDLYYWRNETSETRLQALDKTNLVMGGSAELIFDFKTKKKSFVLSSMNGKDITFIEK